MADTQRTRTALLSLLADNVTGQISAQDLRDFLVTIMNNEFAFTGDFWKGPDAAQLTSEGGRGWFDYSQEMVSLMAFGYLVYLSPSNNWKYACASDVDENCILGVAMSATASGDSGIVLRKGLVWKSAYSGAFNGYIGRPVYLESAVQASIAGPNSAPTAEKIIGYVVDDLNGLYYFDPDWSVVGA